MLHQDMKLIETSLLIQSADYILHLGWGIGCRCVKQRAQSNSADASSEATIGAVHDDHDTSVLRRTERPRRLPIQVPSFGTTVPIACTALHCSETHHHAGHMTY
jgi:hypothetical protein